MRLFVRAWQRRRAEPASGFQRGMRRPIKWRRRSRASEYMADTLSRWLTLREPADIAARTSALDVVTALVRTLGDRGARPLRVLDLGTGTGSNVRFLAPLLSPRQRWVLVDQDPALLSEVPAKLVSWGEARGYVVAAEGMRVRIGDERLT